MASLNLNKVILCGRLTADIELKQTQSGVSVCSFSLAVNRKYSKEGEQQADFINCVAWRSTAEFIGKYFRKGSSICICGSIQTRSYTDKDGNKRTAFEVVVDEANFVDSKGESSASADVGYTPTNAPQYEEVSPDDDLPF
jgi:single-strand DNA-binding protein